MATAKIDKEIVRSQLLKGITPEAIAKYHGCKRQYISLIKQGLVREGKLPKSPAGRKPRQKALATPKTIDIELDQSVELLIRAFEALKRQPELIAERDRYKRGYENIKSVEAARETQDKKRQTQETRYRLARQKPNMAEV